MIRFFALAALLTAGAACSSTDDSGSTTTPAAPSSVAVTAGPATTVAIAAPAATTTTTVEVTTTTAAPTTTLAPTGSVQACDGFLTLDDPDTDGWGECIATLEDAQEQYYVISGTYNGAVDGLNPARQADCDAYIVANRSFVEGLRASTWPVEVQPQLDELVAAVEFDLYVRDESCNYGSQASADESAIRQERAVFEWRTAIGSPTDF